MGLVLQQVITEKHSLSAEGYQCRFVHESGFTLIEILTVLAIVAVLLSLALPGYAGYQRRAIQSDGAVQLLGFVTLQERLRQVRGHYQPAAVLLSLRDLPVRIRRHYSLQVELSMAESRYLLALVPRTDDGEYPRISLDSLGQGQPSSVWR